MAGTEAENKPESLGDTAGESGITERKTIQTEQVEQVQVEVIQLEQNELLQSEFILDDQFASTSHDQPPMSETEVGVRVLGSIVRWASSCVR
jgi:hypothetical protein